MQLGVTLVYPVLFPWGGDDPGRAFPGYFSQVLSCGVTQVLWIIWKLIYGFFKTAVFPLFVMREGLSQNWLEGEKTSQRSTST